jgi:hypothetical protein
MVAPLILEDARYGGNCLKKQGFRHSAQLYRKLTCTDSSEIGQFLAVGGRQKRISMRQNALSDRLFLRAADRSG